VLSTDGAPTVIIEAALVNVKWGTAGQSYCIIAAMVVASAIAPVLLIPPVLLLIPPVIDAPLEPVNNPAR